MAYKDAQVYKTHSNFSRANQENILKKQRTNIKYDESNMINIINDNTLNLHNSLLKMTIDI